MDKEDFPVSVSNWEKTKLGWYFTEIFLRGEGEREDGLLSVFTALPPRVKLDKPRECIKKQRHHFANKGLYSQSYSFSSSHVCT